MTVGAVADGREVDFADNFPLDRTTIAPAMNAIALRLLETLIREDIHLDLYTDICRKKEP